MKLLKRKAQSDDEAKQSIKYFQTRVKADVKDGRARLGLADTYSFGGNFEKAIQILLQAPSQTLEEIYKHAIAETYLEWHMSVAKNSPDDIGKQVDLIDKGLRYEPLNPFLLHRLLEYLSKDGKGSEEANKAIVKFDAEQAKRAAEHAKKVAEQAEKDHQALVRFDAEKGGTATSKFLLGMVAYRKGDIKQAETLFDLAYQAQRDFPILCNNFAWMLAEKQDATPAEIQRALDLVNIAIGRNDVEPSFHDTRGTIYMRQAVALEGKDREKKWEEAATELESILKKSPGFRGAKNIHARLSAIYQELKLPEQAEAHRELAVRLAVK